MKTIFLLDHKKAPEGIGNKASSLHQLQQKGFRIPVTYVCTWHAYRAYQSGDPSLLADLHAELANVIQPGKTYAVRSSANVEDSLENSFAGQFTTVLNVQGIDAVLEAIQTVWQDTQSASVQTYLQRQMGGQSELKMAVVIQEMVQPHLSGVAFSKNPISTLDEVIIEAVIGEGTALVQGGVTPLRWVNKWNGWIIKPENSPIDLEVLEKIVAGTRKIARKFKKEVDLEWVFDGQEIFWVQMRDITSIRDITLYSNRMTREMSPGMQPPLVWSATMRNPSRTWVELIHQLTGQSDIDPYQLIRAFHFRSYINVSLFGKVFKSLGMPEESLEMMLGMLPPGAGKPPMKPSGRTLRLIPRLVGFFYDKWTIGQRLDAEYPDLFTQTRATPCPPAKELDETELLAVIDRIQITNMMLVYNTILSIILMQMYNAMLRRQLLKRGIDHQQFDLTSGMEVLKEFDPDVGLAGLYQDYQQLLAEKQAMVQAGDFRALLQSNSAEEPGIRNFLENFERFVYQFGHLSDTTGHFGNPPWRETPGLLLQLVANYQPHIESHTDRLTYEMLPKHGRLLRLFYNRARQFRLFREQYSSCYTYSLMLLRDYYLAIGDRWAQNGVIDQAPDIFFLFDYEVRDGVAGAANPSTFRQLVIERQNEYMHCKDAQMPETIFGEQAPLMVNATGELYQGTPTSKGYYCGPARIIRSVSDFSRLQAGDVLVIPFSDVSWTPLFAKAGAVIAESGGILSHSSIIAREYNIPAVVSVQGVLQIEDGRLVSIDGFKGEVIVHQEKDSPSDQILTISVDDLNLPDDKLEV